MFSWIFSPLLIMAALQGASAWPRVQTLALRVPVDFRSEKIAIDVPLEDSAGKVIYLFACRGVAETYLDSLPGDWVGPLMCTLAEGTEPSSESLLSEDDSAAWFSRGQFKREDLVGDCARYPEFGAHRSFRLRGFRLTLDAEEVHIDSEGLAQSFVLAISVVPDPGAETPRADRPGFLDPRRAGGRCSVVVRGREPVMCRDETGSWGPCQP